jgi:GTP pyrophosphokinase
MSGEARVQLKAERDERIPGAGRAERMSAGSPHPELRAALMSSVAEKAPRVDPRPARACFDFADHAHGDQRRDSGQPYLTHCVGVCRILLDLLESRIDTTLACAALLHDVAEDTDVTLADVEKSFGREVTSLVEGVTKLSSLHFDSREAAQAENFRKMLLSMSKDLRVIFIKLADRLHNMRTIEFLKGDRARRIAEETRDIYAPLAHRLGMAGIKRELEDGSLKVLDPEAYASLSQRIQVKRLQREAVLGEVGERLREALKAAGVRGEVVGRPKHFYSIYIKMQTGRSLEEIYDLFGLRIITHSRNDCYRALGVVHDQFSPVPERFKDYIATPKSNLYQSLHTTVLTDAGDMVEVQIRTWEMHRTAETGVAAHYVYKQGGRVDEEIDRQLGGFVTQIAGWQNEADDDEYMEYLRTALHQEEVFVYTPRRELKRLAKGATPLDFAFLIHTKVGERTVGARVNGELGAAALRAPERRHGGDRDLAAGQAARGLAEDRAHDAGALEDPALAAVAAARGLGAPRRGDAAARAQAPAGEGGRGRAGAGGEGAGLRHAGGRCTRASPRASSRR